MSIIQMVEASSGGYVVFCPTCMKSIGELSGQEVRDLLLAGIEPKCFDCDPYEVDEIPRQIFSSVDHYFIGYGNYVFLAEWTIDNFRVCPKDLMCSRVSLCTYFDLKTGKGPRYTSLSSSLYLNKEKTSEGRFLDR